MNRATPETELIAKADAAQLEAAIAALSLEFREAFVLRDIQGLEYRETSGAWVTRGDAKIDYRRYARA